MKLKGLQVKAPLINQAVLMSGAEHFSVQELNPYSHAHDQPNVTMAIREHQTIQTALEQAGIIVTKVGAPADCQDGVYTANWALIDGQTAILSSLPGPRQPEQAHAEATLRQLGLRVVQPPHRFSGQGDALIAGPYLLMNNGYRTDARLAPFLAHELGREVITLHTIPARDAQGQPIINALTGWPDSFFYDLDLALAVLTPSLIAWCPAAFDADSQAKVRSLKLDQIEVGYQEAVQSFACNLISTGHTVVMSATAPQLQAAIEARGLTTITPTITELSKGGGYIRCIALTLDDNHPSI